MQLLQELLWYNQSGASYKFNKCYTVLIIIFYLPFLLRLLVGTLQKYLIGRMSCVFEQLIPHSNRDGLRLSRLELSAWNYLLRFHVMSHIVRARNIRTI